MDFFASNLNAEQSADLFSSIGIDWKLMILQTIAFLLLLWILKKLVYPPLVKMLDKRDADLKAGQKAADEARNAADRAEAETAKLLKEARNEANQIVALAKDEAAAAVKSAETKAKAKSAAILKSAEEDLARQVASAKKQLYNQTIDLVALATEKVVGKKLTKNVDEDLIAASIKEAQ